MIGELKIEGYRGFESYRLEGLARVNLLVGKNNCGKSSILEAVQLLVSGDVANLAHFSKTRDELVSYHPVSNTPSLPGTSSHINLANYFYSYKSEIGSNLSISCNDNIKFSMKMAEQCVEEDNNSHPELGTVLTKSGIPRRLNHLYNLVIESSVREKETILMGSPKFLNYTNASLLGNQSQEFNDEVPSTIMITSTSLVKTTMDRLWDTIVVEGIEDKVVKALQIIEPDIRSIHFMTKPGSIVVGIGGQKKRVPLGSMGDGMRRMLSLSLALANVQGGVLLIDEIDTGLHWTVMADMWKLIIQAADEFDIQVFATTHSQDCIRGLGDLLETSPHLGDKVSLQKIDRRLEKAVNLNGKDICTAVEQEIEVR